MSNRIFHVLNIVMLLAFLVPFNLFAWFGNAISAVSSPSINFSIIASFVLWGLFYIIQFQKRTLVWRLTWFIIAVGVQWYWGFGGGASFWRFMFD